MKVRVLGCSGGLGEVGARTTSLLVDHDILIDAGTGVSDLSLDELAAIDHVFVTHSHMDHIACLPLLIDAVWERRQSPVTVHASAATIDILKAHIFNWAVWPDFTLLPAVERPALVFSPIAVGQRVNVAGRGVSATPANHTVPALGYVVHGPAHSLAFTGDTAPCEALWPALNAIPDLRYLITEVAFPDSDNLLVRAAKHLTPSMLANELALLEQTPEIWVSHMKTGKARQTCSDLAALSLKLAVLNRGQTFVC